MNKPTLLSPYEVTQKIMKYLGIEKGELPYELDQYFIVFYVIAEAQREKDIEFYGGKSNG